MRGYYPVRSQPAPQSLRYRPEMRRFRQWADGGLSPRRRLFWSAPWSPSGARVSFAPSNCWQHCMARLGYAE